MFSDLESSDTGDAPSTRLVAACSTGDVHTVSALIADGVVVNDGAVLVDCVGSVTPLRAAVLNRHLDVVVALLAAGADANRGDAMFVGVCFSNPVILRLLLDAGGDVAQTTRGTLPVYWVVRDIGVNAGGSTDMLQVLLPEPRVDLVGVYDGRTAEEYARGGGKHTAARLLVAEVSRVRSLGWVWVWVLVVRVVVCVLVAVRVRVAVCTAVCVVAVCVAVCVVVRVRVVVRARAALVLARHCLTAMPVVDVPVLACLVQRVRRAAQVRAQVHVIHAPLQHHALVIYCACTCGLVTPSDCVVPCPDGRTARGRAGGSGSRKPGPTGAWERTVRSRLQ